MKATNRKKHRFYKVAPCLYRYRPTGIYYARINTRGREITHSLRTADRVEALGKLAELRASRSRLDPRAGKIVLASLVEKYQTTFAHQKRKTQQFKTLVLQRVQKDWPTGALT